MGYNRLVSVGLQYGLRQIFINRAATWAAMDFLSVGQQYGLQQTFLSRAAVWVTIDFSQ